MIALRESLERIGLSDKETKMFLVSLELGPQTASVLSKRAGLNRSTSYMVLDALVRKGLMSSFVSNRVKRYQAVDPTKLLRFVDNKLEDLSESKREIEYLLPNLEALFNNPYQNRPKVKYFDGTEGIKTVMEDTLSATEELRCYSSLSRWLDSPLQKYIRAYGKRRMFEKKIPLRALVFDQPVARDYLDNEYADVLHQCRYVDADIIDNETNIYDNKIAIVSLRPNDYFGLLIESDQLAATQKSIFDLAWDAAIKKP